MTLGKVKKEEKKHLTIVTMQSSHGMQSFLFDGAQPRVLITPKYRKQREASEHEIPRNTFVLFFYNLTL